MKISVESTDRKGLIGIYNDSISQLPRELHLVSGVLYCCVETIVFAYTNTLLKAEPGVISTKQNSDLEFSTVGGSSLEISVDDDAKEEIQLESKFISDVLPPANILSPDLEFITLQTTGLHGTFQCLLNKPPNPVRSGIEFIPKDDKNVIVVDMDDRLRKTASSIQRDIQDKKKRKNKNQSLQSSKKLSEEGLQEFEMNAVCRSQIYRFLSSRTLPLKAVLNTVERGIKETELLSFSSLSTTDLYRSNQLQEINEMLLSVVQPLPNFTGAISSANSGSGEEGSVLRRRFFRELSGLVFAQILSSNLCMEPTVVQRYYPLTDQLLYSLSWPPLKRRMSRSSWDRPLSAQAISFSAPQDDKSIVSEASKPNSKARAKVVKGKRLNESGQASTDASTVEVASTAIETVTLTPAGKSLAFIKKFCSTGQVWLSVYSNGSLLGLRTDRSIPPPDEQPTATAAEEDEKADVNAELDNKNPAAAQHIDGANTAQDNAEDTSTVVTSASQIPLVTDDVRIIAYPGPSPTPTKKPDKLGTACLALTYPHGLTVNACSNGNIKIEPPSVSAVPLRKKAAALEPLLYERSRVIGAEGLILRNLVTAVSDGSSCPYSKDIMAADGTRTLVRAFSSRPGPTLLRKLSSQKERVQAAGSDDDGGGGARIDGEDSIASSEDNNSLAEGKGDNEASEINEDVKLNLLSDFHRELLSGAPSGWRYVRLAPDGSVLFFTCMPGALIESKGIPHPTMKSIMDFKVDAESKCNVSTYKDGRLVLKFFDGRRECIYNEGTKIITHSSGGALLIERVDLPYIEIDLEIDSMCRSHANGIEVPIKKGGLRVRARIALPDGSALLIKYDTKVTATSNGSVKLVRRDRTVMQVQDSGVVSYTPRTAWNSEAAKQFSDECKDGIEIVPTQPTSSPTADTKTRSKSRSRGGVLRPNSEVNFEGTTRSPTSRRSTSVGRRAISPKKYNGDSEAKSSDDVFISTEAKESKYTIDFLKFTCRIQDYEYNCFDIDLLNNPMDPTVNLSGEVAGLKPPAVTDTPMDPRVFIVNRAGDATEVVGINDINSLESYVLHCREDCYKIISEVEVQPSDLGPAKMHKYVIQKRMLGKHGDGFAFGEVFGSRIWQRADYPAAALFVMRSNQALKYRRPDATFAPQRYFETVTLVEHQPLSQEGYARLKQDFARCEDFRKQRLTSIDRFAVEDHRTHAELEEEEAIIKKLKQAYKIAKVNAAKRKEAREREKATAQPEVENGSLQSIILEGDEEDSDDQEAFADDEDEAEPDPEQMEVNNTFYDFAVEMYHDEESSTDSTTLLPMASLQDALIRLLNRFVSPNVIEDALKDCGGFDSSIGELTLPEFRGIHKSVRKFLLGIVDNDEDDGGDSPGTPLNSFSFDVDGKDMMPKSSRSGGRAGTLKRSGRTRKSLQSGKNLSRPSTPEHDDSKHGSRNRPIDEYWSSPIGKKSISLIPKMALPLDLRPLRRDAEDRDLDGGDTNGAATAGGLDYPAGAAFNAVRKNSNGNIMY